MQAAIRRPQDMFPSTLFSVEAGASNGDEASLHPLERALVERAVSKRRREFAAGRVYAHRALTRLQVVPGPILSDRHGCPLWPTGTLGSISHTEGCAISVAATSGRVTAVGVDVDRRNNAFSHVVLRHICREEELRWISGLPGMLVPMYGLLLFSIKEAIYKCVYAATGERLGFSDASVALDLSQGLFSARLLREVSEDGRDRLIGRVGCNEDYVFSGLWWPSFDPSTSQQSPLRHSDPSRNANVHERRL
jgi:4'-phosphopantetheinyl transferase EntD